MPSPQECVGSRKDTGASYRLVPDVHRPLARKVEPKPPPQRRQSDRTARMLALAHHVEVLVVEGRLPDYAAAARVLSLTRARMTQVMTLVLLAPESQEHVILGRLPLTERSLRLDLRGQDWEIQRSGVGARVLIGDQGSKPESAWPRPLS